MVIPASPAIVHLIPYDGTGGVEAAARSFASGDYRGLRFLKYFLADKSSPSLSRQGDCSGSFYSENDLRNYLQVLNWLHRCRPALLVASLWRTYAVLLMHKLFHPRCKVVCFLHCEHAVHGLDQTLSFIAMALASEIWADSRSTLNLRVPRVWRHKGKVISFVLEHLHPVTMDVPSPHFVFWGRLAPQKGLATALQIIAILKRQRADIHFNIIGPDLGELSNLERLVDQLGLADVVYFLGPRTFREIREVAARSSFYLQPSLYEGMAVSVVEAMQLGLVPIVTPVGEIVRYCQNNVNSLLVESNGIEIAASRIERVLGDCRQFALLRDQAICTWHDAPIYREEVLDRCAALLAT